jgi:hypothetical protein
MAVMAAARVLFWRFGYPIERSRPLTYLVGACLVAGATARIWELTSVGLPPLIVHVGGSSCCLPRSPITSGAPSPARSPRLAFERAHQFRGYPAAVETAGLRQNGFAADTAVQITGVEGNTVR